MSLLQQGSRNSLDNLTQVILFIVTIILVAVALYIAIRIFTKKRDLEAGYIIRLLVVAIVAVLGIPAVLAAINSLNQISIADHGLAEIFGLTALYLVIIFIIVVYLIKFILIPEEGELSKWSVGIWGAFVALLIIAAINSISIILFGAPIIQFPGL